MPVKIGRGSFVVKIHENDASLFFIVYRDLCDILTKKDYFEPRSIRLKSTPRCPRYAPQAPHSINHRRKMAGSSRRLRNDPQKHKHEYGQFITRTVRWVGRGGRGGITFGSAMRGNRIRGMGTTARVNADSSVLVCDMCYTFFAKHNKPCRIDRQQPITENPSHPRQGPLPQRTHPTQKTPAQPLDCRTSNESPVPHPYVNGCWDTITCDAPHETWRAIDGDG